MSESKELLEATIKGLEEKLNQLNSDLRSKERELADVSKPEMTDVMFDQITYLVDDAMTNACLDEGSLEYSMCLGYDNKVELEDVSLNDSSVFSEKIMCAIDSHYKLVETVNPTESTSG